MTVDIERSVITMPVEKGGGLNVTVDFDDSTDDESVPRKAIPLQTPYVTKRVGNY